MKPIITIELGKGEQTTIKVDSCGNTIWREPEKTDSVIAKNRFKNYLCIIAGFWIGCLCWAKIFPWLCELLFIDYFCM